MRVLYVTSSPYPGDNAYATRIYGICKSLRHANIHTDVLTDYSKLNVGQFEYEGSNIYVGAKRRYDDRTAVDKLLTHHRMYKTLRELLSQVKYDCVITRSMYKRVDTIIKMARSRRIPVILESCEWHGEYNWRRGAKSREYKRYVRAWNQSFIKADGVIAISRLLEERYKEFVPNVIRIPTMMEIPSEYANQSNGKPIKLVFTGYLARGKDRLIELINALDLIHEEHSKIELHIYGPTARDVNSQLNDEGTLKRNSDRIFIHGQISHEETLRKCMESDFGIILRPNRRQSNAGFPTKLAEYMSSGASVITNDTGDIGLYVQNQANGFLLPTVFTVEQLKTVLLDIVHMDRDALSQMKKRAFETAVKSFDYRLYADELRNFIEKVIKDYARQSIKNYSNEK